MFQVGAAGWEFEEKIELQLSDDDDTTGSQSGNVIGCLSFNILFKLVGQEGTLHDRLAAHTISSVMDKIVTIDQVWKDSEDDK